MKKVHILFIIKNMDTIIFFLIRYEPEPFDKLTNAKKLK